MQQLPAPRLGVCREGRKRARAGQVRGLQGSSPRVPAQSRREGRLAALPAGPAAASPRARVSPRSFLSRCLRRRGYFLFYFIAVEIKHPLGAIETAGQVVFLQSLPAPRRAGAGLPARSWRGLRAQSPPRTGCGAAESRIFMLYFKKFK